MWDLLGFSIGLILMNDLFLVKYEISVLLLDSKDFHNEIYHYLFLIGKIQLTGYASC